VSRGREVIAELETIFSARTRAQWMELLDGKDVCVGPVNDFAEALSDDHLKSRAMLVDTELPGAGSATAVGTPIRIDADDQGRPRRPPPRMGEHTAEILEELRVSAEDAEVLRSAGAI
jgi:crotonobetainyl-CoA:carnitine CoA-transferase CaiB-like acyl-CoA transferase